MNMHYIHVQSELDSDVWSAGSEYMKILINLTTNNIIHLGPDLETSRIMRTIWFCFFIVTHDEVVVRRYSCDYQTCLNARRNVTHIGKV